MSFRTGSPVNGRSFQSLSFQAWCCASYWPCRFVATLAGSCFNLAFTVALLAALGWLSYRSLMGDRADEKYRQVVAAEGRQTSRVFALAGHEGIPRPGR